MHPRAPTTAVHDPRVLLRRDVLRAFEHHVLEQMSETGHARLVARADPHPHLKRDNRGGVVFECDEGQTVVEHRLTGPKHGIVDRGVRSTVSTRQDSQRHDRRCKESAGRAHGGVQYRSGSEVSR